MNKKPLLPFALAAVSTLLYAQGKSPQVISKPSIEIEGVKLQLGMTKAEVSERLVGTQITKMNEDRWIIGSYGMTSFKSGGDDQIDAIFGAVSSLNREGYTSFKVLAESKTIPVTDASTGRTLAASNFERVWIACGAKAVLIVKANVGGHLNVDVSEQLGHLDLASE